ncbi:PAS domain S-box-containing protein [Mariprofundus ferrinatatus]|uniref:histidine kinase n=1 Tax=Mariprofundus ferrinatatus TaxID=1921087 RepID=A0A2K8L8U2_9PROT|nr:PAS domain S-box protein [Mariprofundus ferrinatatus]ATX81344.1 PAS domain S-box-containing protein [Mariprofundus ferrinatatus]
MVSSDSNGHRQSAAFSLSGRTIRYFLLTFFPIAMLIAAVGFSIYYLEAKNRVKVLIEQNRSMIERQREAIIHDFDLILSDVVYLAAQSELSDAFGERGPEALEDIAHEYMVFSQSKKIYDQVRFIDNEGMERIRINFNDGLASVVPAEQLQSKQNRYYFTKAINLKPGEVYISRFDLNMEHGEVEVPHKPMIRFSAPVFTEDGSRLGIVVVNYLGNQLLEHFVKIHARNPHLSHLVDSNGYWLHSNPHGLAWGFMFKDRRDVRFQRDHPEAWREISSKLRGHIENKMGVYCYSTVDIFSDEEKNPESRYKSDTGNWKIIAYNPTAEIEAMLASTRHRTFLWGGVALLIAAFISLALARAVSRRIDAERAAYLSEIRINEAVRIALDSVISIDHEGRIIEFNKAAEDTFGYRKEEIIGQTIQESIIPDRFRAKHLRGMRKHLDAEKPLAINKRIEAMAQHRDGHEFPIELSISPIKTEDSPIFTAFIRDLSEKRQSEEKILKLSKAIEHAGESIMITDKDGSIEYVNPAFCKITGFSVDEAIGNNPRILNSGEHPAEYFQEMWDTILGRKTWQRRIVVKRKEGSQFPAILTISPIFDSEGNISHFVGLHQSIEDYEALEERFHQAQKMEAIGTLVGGIAHDFNNTLAGITGNLYLLKKKTKVQPEIIKRLETIENLSFRASDMIQQLLSFSRRTIVQMKPLNLPPFIKETAKLHKVSIPENITLEYQVGSEAIYVRADLNQLQQVMVNLLNNARDAVQDRDDPRITISLKRYSASKAFRHEHPEVDTQDFALISVADNGSGINENDLDLIFDPFFTTKDVGKGTGLGLSMVYGTVQTHGGVITVKSKTGKGSRFDIYLPVVDSEPAEQHAQSGHEPSIEKGEGETILVVDDDEVLITTVQEIVEGMGYRVLTANNGIEAVELFRSHNRTIRLVVLDLVMPRLGGVEALLEMRKIDPDIPCIFTTGYDQQKVMNTEKVNGVEVLRKPYEVTELGRLISEKLKKGQ